jgi:mono/diheme cytochrome c family protein
MGLFACLTSAACGWLTPHVAGSEGEADFARDVAPIFEQHCIRCHHPDNAKGDLSLATAADLTANGYITPGKPDESYLLDIVTSSSGERPAMPQEGGPLPDEEIERLRRWIADGATWPASVVIREKSKADASWWSLQRLAAVEPPATAGLPDAWQANPIDRFVYQRLAQENLSPSPRADKRTLIRRLTYDLTGLPPTPEEVESFVADESPDAYSRLVDRLLASPHYGEQWGRHWLDVVRFGESRGFERNEIIDNAWPFRDYVIRSFNQDKSFAALVREHLAGDVIGQGDPDVEAGVTFLVGGPYDDVGNQDAVQAAQIRANTIDEMIRATAEAFLGLTVGCARCHDHKFDPVLQRDYYGLYATFAGVHHGSRAVATAEQRQTRDEALRPLHESRDRLMKELADLNAVIEKRAQEGAEGLESQWTRPPIRRTGVEERFAAVPAKFVRLVVEGVENNPDARNGFGIDEFEVWTSGGAPRNVALTTAGGQAAGQGRVAADFAGAYSPALTIDGKFGARWLAAGPELTIALSQLETVDRIVFSSDRNGDAGDHSVAAFVSEYRVEVSRDSQQWTPVADSRDRQPVNTAHRRKRLIDAAITEPQRQQQADLNRQLAEVNGRINAVPSLPMWWVGEFKPIADKFHVFVGGDPQRRGAQVAPASLSALDAVVAPYQLSDDAAESQRRLQLADWLTHPDNPLTPRVLANRLWHYHFGIGIVETPSDFGYMGGRPTHPELLDWLARQVHRHGWRLKPLHRLIVMSETYRQSSAFRAEAAGADADSRLLWRFPPRRLTAEEIRDTMLSVAGKLNLEMGGPGFRLYRYVQDNVATYIPLGEHGPETYRRAVYHQNARASLLDLLTEFDCPDSSFSAPRRAATTTPLQALTLMNHRFSVDMANDFARRLEQEAGTGTEALVRRAFVLTYSRAPATDELAAAVTLIDRHGLRAFCRAVLNSNETIHLN